MKKSPLEIRPITLKAAKEFVAKFHRHNKPPVGHKFSISIYLQNEMVGVVICGRPIARYFDDGMTLEVSRSCTTGEKNCNSMLYGAAWRAAKAMGYRRLVTYTQGDESGVSLRAAGFTRVKDLPARKSWFESSVKYCSKRDPVGSGGIRRVLWEVKIKDYCLEE